MAAITAAGAAAAADATPAAAATTAPAKPAVATVNPAYGMIGKAKISRLMLGGNLVSGFMHARDLRYVTTLFRAYVTEEKIFETFRLAEENGINTVFESGQALVERYNKERGGHLQIIPSIHPKIGMDEHKLKYEIKAKVDSGVPAMYVWGVAADALVQAGEVGADRPGRRAGQGARHSGRGGRALAESAHGLREGRHPLRLLREDLPQRQLSLGHTQGAAGRLPRR